MDCQGHGCQRRRRMGQKPYRAKYFIRAARDRRFVCGYCARAWVKAVREPIENYSARG